MKHTASTVIVFLSMSVFGCREHAEHAEHATPSGSSTPPTNPVQNEMLLLTAALESTVRAIGAGDVRVVEHELHRVHAAKEATEAALKSGAYHPPKNADHLERFEERDEAFHHDLERLASAGRQNDVPGTAEALGNVLRACQGCHVEFRR